MGRYFLCTTNWCDELNKAVGDVTVKELMDDCPKAFITCEQCEHCKKVQYTTYVTDEELRMMPF